MSNKSVAELEKSHVVIGLGAAIKSEALQAIRQHWEVAVKYTTADALFQKKHVTAISPLSLSRPPLTGTLEVVNIILPHGTSLQFASLCVHG